jgi:hypothetical protein
MPQKVMDTLYKKRSPPVGTAGLSNDAIRLLFFISFELKYYRPLIPAIDCSL